MNRIHTSLLLAAGQLFITLGCNSEVASQTSPGDGVQVDASDIDSSLPDSAADHASVGHDDAADEALVEAGDPDAGPDADDPDADDPDGEAVPDASGEAASGDPPYYLPDECGPAGQQFDCDPLASTGCSTSAGWVCDFAAGGFACYPPPNDGVEGQACNVNDGPLCGLGLTCAGSNAGNPNGVCQRFCCSDDDCASTQQCIAFSADFGTLGACQ